MSPSRHPYEPVLNHGHDALMSDWPSIAITAAATLLSALLASGISLLVVRKQIRAQEMADLAAAAQAHGYAADRLASEIALLRRRLWGASNKHPRRRIAHRPHLDWWIGLIARHSLGRPALRALDAYSAATNRLMLIAPKDMLTHLEHLNELLTELDRRQTEWHEGWTETWWADWNATRGALLASARRSIVKRERALGLSNHLRTRLLCF